MLQIAGGISVLTTHKGAVYNTAPLCVSVQSASCRNLKCQSHFLYLKYQIVRAEQKIISPMAKM